MLFTRAYATRFLLMEACDSGLAVLRTDEPRLLLEAADVVVEDVGGGGVLGVDLLVHVAHGADGRVDGGDGELLGVVGLDERLGDGREGVALGDDLGQAVGDDLEGAHALGDLVGGLAGDVNDIVQVQVERAEALARDVPVQLLAHEGQSGHVGEDLLQVACENVGSLETSGLNGHDESPLRIISVRV